MIEVQPAPPAVHSRNVRTEVMECIANELDHAYAKHGRAAWGKHEFYGIICEEFEEMKAAIFRDEPMDRVLKEAIEVAAMIFRYAETGDRYSGDHPALPRRNPDPPCINDLTGVS